MSTPTSLSDQYNILKKFVLDNDAAALEAALQSADQKNVLEYTSTDQPFLLYLAVEENFVAIAKVLLRAKADVNQCFDRHGTALMYAAACGRDEMVELLLQQPGIAIDATDTGKETALTRAVVEGHTRIVPRLLDANASIGDTLILAARADLCPILELLLQRNADVNATDLEGTSSLHVAALSGFHNAVSILLAANANVDLANCRGMSPLMSACIYQRLEVVHLLLAAGANLEHRSAHGKTALHCAFYDITFVDVLLQAGANPNAKDAKGRSVLLLAAESYVDLTPTMKSLLSAKADVDLADDRGNTPLLWAVATDHPHRVQLLLDNGADILKKADRSAKQLARGKVSTHDMFECSLCGWEGMCCLKCRRKYCVIECDKFSDPQNKDKSNETMDCKLHERVAHQSIVEWAIAMAPLQLPPYVVEHIFNSLKLNSTHQDYQQRKGIDLLWIANNEKTAKINDNFIHLLVEEKTHSANIHLFISVHKMYQNKQKN